MVRNVAVAGIAALFLAAAVFAEAANGPADWDGRPEGRAWSAMLGRAIDEDGQALLDPARAPVDIGAYCPGYTAAPPGARRAFWIGLVSALARYESGFNPRSTYTENFADARQQPVVSRGLLQISIESANQPRHGCGIARAEDLYDPATNLRCAVRIMRRWVPNDRALWGRPTSGHPNWQGMSAYWSPFRDESKRAAIARYTAQQPYCRISAPERPQPEPAPMAGGWQVDGEAPKPSAGDDALSYRSGTDRVTFQETWPATGGSVVLTHPVTFALGHRRTTVGLRLAGNTRPVLLEIRDDSGALIRRAELPPGRTGTTTLWHSATIHGRGMLMIRVEGYAGTTRGWIGPVVTRR